MKNQFRLKIVGTFLLTIGLSLLVVFLRPQTAYSKLISDWFWVNKTHYSTNVDVVFVGDSRIYRGISTEAVQMILTDEKVLNLGYSSGGLNNEMFDFATQLLDVNSKNKQIVLGVTPFSLTEEARKNEHFEQELNRPLAEIIEREYINPNISLFEPIKITDYQIVLDNRFYSQKFHKNGWVESYKTPANNEEALIAYEETFSKTKLSDISIDETLSFITRMKEKGIKVYGFRPPSSKKMEELENNMTEFDEEKLQQMFEESGGYWITIPDRFSFESYDGSHLHYESAQKLSIFIAKKIKE